MEISWIDRVRNDEVLHRVKVKRNIVHTKKEGRMLEFFTYCVESVV
jgi:hypothetical protein